MNLMKVVRFLNALHVLVLCGALLGAFSMYYVLKEAPSSLCLLQRIGITGVAIALLCNLKFGIRPLHYGLGILSGVFGISISLKQVAFSASRSVLGLNPCWWPVIVFVSSLIMMALYLFLYNQDQSKRVKMSWFEKSVFWLMIWITFSNIVVTFAECGFGVCKG